MFNYNKFFSENPVNIHDQPERHSTIAALCGARVLDIGCGTGTLSEYYFGNYHGVDVSSVAIKKAREARRHDARFDVCDTTQKTALNFFDYDTIVMSEFLEHVDNDLILFSDIKENAKPGTKLIISLPNGEAVPSPDHVRTFTAAEILKKFKNFGTVKFIDWPGQKSRLLFTIELGVFSTPILSLAIIAKDEDQGIEQAILSCLPFVDDIVVCVDDSTTDQTAEIAKKYTDNVYMFRWDDDFSAARNFALARVQTPWVLFLDGHEYLKIPPDRDLLQKTSFDAIMCQNQLENGLIIRYPRLHRRNLVYKDKVHNSLVCNNVGAVGDVLIIHDRINSQSAESIEAREKQRHDMLTRIMGAQLKKNKKNTRASMHLGLHFHARKKFKKAIKYYNMYLRYSRNAGERWYIRYNLILCYLSLSRFLFAEYHCHLLEFESQNRWETRYIRGMVFMAQKKFSEAIEFFVSSFESHKQESDYKPIQRDSGVTWNLIGECFFGLGQYYEAGEAFRRSAKTAKNAMLKNLSGRRSKLMFAMAKK